MNEKVFNIGLEELEQVKESAENWRAYDTTVKGWVSTVIDFVCENSRWEEYRNSFVWLARELFVNAGSAARRNLSPAAPVANTAILIIGRRFDESDDFEILICNTGVPVERDRLEILRRFENYDETRAEIESLRKKYTKPNGSVCIPTTTGGGGLALLESIRWSREKGVHFSLQTEEKPPMTIFRLGNRPPN